MDFDGGCLNFTPEQKAERLQFVRLLRSDLGCADDESIRATIEKWAERLAQLEAENERLKAGWDAANIATATASMELSTASEQLAEAKGIISGYEEWHADVKRLTRELDVILSGEEGAAKQASLCDLLPIAAQLTAKLAEAEARGNKHAG